MGDNQNLREINSRTRWRIEGRGKKRATQLAAIRDLMIAEAFRGEWLTLGEIAARTEIGEATVSAQLRHLRKECNGGYCVEKRLRHGTKRDDVAGAAPDAAYDASDRTVWEYRVRVPLVATSEEAREASEAFVMR
jgi:hypothetical protein